ASFTALPARFPRVPFSPVVKPCSASAASAAVAATATSSATSGLWRSLMNASPIPLSDDRPPPLELEAGASALDEVALFDLLLLPVAFLAIFECSCVLFGVLNSRDASPYPQRASQGCRHRHILHSASDPCRRPASASPASPSGERPRPSDWLRR